LGSSTEKTMPGGRETPWPSVAVWDPTGSSLVGAVGYDDLVISVKLPVSAPFAAFFSGLSGCCGRGAQESDCAGGVSGAGALCLIAGGRSTGSGFDCRRS